MIAPHGPVFDKPLWRILRADDLIEYRPGLTNEVSVGPWGRLDAVSHSVFIHVPADLFSYLRFCGFHRAKEIRLRLLAGGHEEFRFCITVNSRIEWLWNYRDLPVWAEVSKERRV